MTNHNDDNNAIGRLMRESMDVDVPPEIESSARRQLNDLRSGLSKDSGHGLVRQVALDSDHEDTFEINRSNQFTSQVGYCRFRRHEVRREMEPSQGPRSTVTNGGDFDIA